MTNRETNVVLCVLAYFSILFLVPYLVDRTNEDYLFHANQGFNLFILSLVNSFLARIVAPLGLNIVPSLLNLAILGLVIYGVYNTVQKKNVELPVIGQYKWLN